MTELSWWWDGHTTGDAATQTPYAKEQWAGVYLRLLTTDYFKQGVIGGTLDSLVVTASSASSVSVASGAAIVDGKIYHNDAPINFSVSGESVYWLIGLATNQDAQNVRAFSRGGYTSEADAIASLAWFSSHWEIPLALVFTQTNGTIQTIIDKRLFVLRPEKEREFVPATGCYNYTDTVDVLKTGAPGPEGYLLTDGKYVSCYGNFLVPNNFWKLLTVKSIVLSLANTGNIYSKTYVEYGSFYDPNSEEYNAHVVSKGFVVSPVTVSYSSIVNPTPEISDLARGQYNPAGYPEGEFLCLTFTRDATSLLDTAGTEVYFVGWLVEYMVLY